MSKVLRRRVVSSPVRGQFSIDFFLVLSIVIAFAVLLYNVAISEVGKSTLLDSAILGQNTLDSIASGIDFAAFAGNGSHVRKELWLPADVNCLFFNQSANHFYCFVSSGYLPSSKNRLVSRTLLSSLGSNLALQCVPRPGWFAADFSNNGTNVVLACHPI
ncbi:hypothetical protein HY994_06185 [Candidatus Micrarchaeota archaeon]|nr:hypothetical protein [Candidatus Micrarchaeota archaeon]